MEGHGKQAPRVCTQQMWQEDILKEHMEVKLLVTLDLYILHVL